MEHRTIKVGDLVPRQHSKPKLRKLQVGDRVRVTNSLLYTDRTGVLVQASTDEDGYTIWDFGVELDAVEPAADATRAGRTISEARTIGVALDQILPIS